MLPGYKLELKQKLSEVGKVKESVNKSLVKSLVNYLSELRRDFLASVGIIYAVFRIAKSRLRAFSKFC